MENKHVNSFENLNAYLGTCLASLTVFLMIFKITDTSDFVQFGHYACFY